MRTRRKSLFASVLALAATRPVFTADYYFVDGVTGKVASFIDWNDATHLLAQSTSANQVAIPAAHADFGGRLCATGTGVEFYDSNRAASAWALHDGSGWSVHAVATLTSAGSRRLFATTSGGAFLGADLYYSVGPGAGWFCGNASATVISQTASPITLSAPHQISGQYLEGGALPNESSFKITGFAEVNGNSVAVPSASAAATMRLFANPGAAAGTVPFVGRWWGGVFGPAFDATTRAKMRTNLQVLTGVAA